MKKGWHHFTWDDRIRIETFCKCRTSVKTIASELGCTPQAVYTELKRGLFQKKVSYRDSYGYETLYKFVDCYSPDIAQEKYEQHLRDKGTDIKLGCDHAFADYVEKMICDEGYSPEAVLKKIEGDETLNFDTVCCVNTLYSWIYKGVFGRLTAKDLMFGGKRHKIKSYRTKKKRCRDNGGLSIEKRLPEINDRSEFGHWEMDCICGSTKPCLLTLCERSSRYTLIFRIPDQKAVSVVGILNKLERMYGKKFRQVFKSITVDNGSEFSDFSGMSTSVYSVKIKRCAIYYTHPYSAWERGTNERLNREVRRKIPKGSDLSLLTDDVVSGVQTWVNDYPRGVLGFASSSEVFESCMASV